MTIRMAGTFAALGLAALTAGCGGSTTARDQGIDSHALETMAASVWVDPDGCKHWVIDDGVEGYMSPVLNLDGTPDCV
ncbi:MAG: hypothetical protein AAGH68_00200 [Pseudomonadota bacterium]